MNPKYPEWIGTIRSEQELAEWVSLNPGGAYQLTRWLVARLYAPERDALTDELLPLSSEWLRGVRWAKVGCGVMAALVLGFLAWVAWLSGPIERGHAVLAAAALAFLVFWEWRKTRRRKPDSCINCQRDAQFCRPCCDAISAPNGSAPPETKRNPNGVPFCSCCGASPEHQPSHQIERLMSLRGKGAPK